MVALTRDLNEVGLHASKGGLAAPRERVLQLGFVTGGVPEESQAAADAESPRAGAKRERDLCDIPASLSSPLLAAKRRSGRDSSSGMSHVRLPPAHGGRERESRS